MSEGIGTFSDPGVFAEAPKPVPPVRQVIDGIKWQDIPPHVREKLVMKTTRKFLTRNSACVCGSGKRYKRCCGKGTGV
jgi:uncharacterized protein YecA (UPF0149 family)